MDFNYYLKNGFLKKQPPNLKQIEQQIARAEKDLLTAALVMEKDPEWGASISYHAMLRAGRALLFSFGFLPSDGRQHKTVVEVTGKLLGEDFNLVVRQFEKLRKKRNTFFYDATDTSNLAEAKMAAAAAKNLINAIKKTISGNSPQIKMHLE